MMNMDWVSRLNNAMNYIEDNLENEIDHEKLAQLACCSTFHFQRMFSYMARVPLAEYIRRRRMTKAAFDLQNSDEKIITIANRYGYDSPTAFNRAFHGIHSVSPSVARQQGVALKAYYPISFKITIRGEEEMNYQIETKEAFRIVGMKKEINWSPENQEGFLEVPQFWQEQHQKNSIPTLCSYMNNTPLGVLGVSVGDWQTSGKFDYYIGVASTKPLDKENVFAQQLSEYVVPACTWAIFECKGPMPTAIQTMQERIMTEWLPNSGYHYFDAPDIEVYGDGDQSSDDYMCWIWVPVTK